MSAGAVEGGRSGEAMSDKSSLPGLNKTFKIIDVDINLKVAAKSESLSNNPQRWKLKYWARRRDSHKRDLKISLKVVKESDTLEVFQDNHGNEYLDAFFCCERFGHYVMK